MLDSGEIKALLSIMFRPLRSLPGTKYSYLFHSIANRSEMIQKHLA